MKKPLDISGLKVQIRNKLRNYLYDLTRRNPMILPIILELSANDKIEEIDFN